MQLSGNSAQKEGSSSEGKHPATSSACCHKGLQGEHRTLEPCPHRSNRDDGAYVRKDLDNFSIWKPMEAFYSQKAGTK